MSIVVVVKKSIGKLLITYALVDKYYIVAHAKTNELLDIAYRYILGVMFGTNEIT